MSGPIFPPVSNSTWHCAQVRVKIARPRAASNGGFFAKEDFAQHHSTWDAPISTDYRGYTVWELPPNSQGLAALQEKPGREPASLNWRGPYLKKAVPLDPWGRAYSYASPGEHSPGGYDLSTLGRDGQPGGENDNADVVSWK